MERITPHEQEQDFSCGPTSLKIAYEAFYHYREEAEIAKEMGMTNEGAEWSQMVNHAGNEGFDVSLQKDGSWEDVRRLWKTGWVVIVCFQHGNEEDKGSHFSVVSEVGNGWIKLADPAVGKMVDYDRHHFETRWYDDEGVKTYMAIKKSFKRDNGDL